MTAQTYGDHGFSKVAKRLAVLQKREWLLRAAPIQQALNLMLGTLVRLSALQGERSASPSPSSSCVRKAPRSARRPPSGSCQGTGP